MEQRWLVSNFLVRVSVGSSLFSYFLRMLGRMDGWFSKVKVPEKSVEMEVTSEGSDGHRLLDKGEESLCLHFLLLVFLQQILRIFGWMVDQFSKLRKK